MFRGYKLLFYGLHCLFINKFHAIYWPGIWCCAVEKSSHLFFAFWHRLSFALYQIESSLAHCVEAFRDNRPVIIANRLRFHFSERISEKLQMPVSMANWRVGFLCCLSGLWLLMSWLACLGEFVLCDMSEENTTKLSIRARKCVLCCVPWF